MKRFGPGFQIEDLPDGTVSIIGVDQGIPNGDYTCQVEVIYDPKTGIFTVVDETFWKRVAG